jgi:NitT/TauT family transport system ATP-binding protein
VRFTRAGKRFVQADVNDRKQLFRGGCQALATFRLVIDLLARRPEKRLPAEVIREHLALALTNERPQAVFETLVNWGRYAEILSFDTGADEVALLL